MKDEFYDLPVLYWIPKLPSVLPSLSFLNFEVVLIKCGYSKTQKTCWNLSSRSQFVCNSIKTFDFSTLYTDYHVSYPSLIVSLSSQCIAFCADKNDAVSGLICRNYNIFVVKHLISLPYIPTLHIRNKI
jgi:hypothetical protein